MKKYSRCCIFFGIKINFYITKYDINSVNLLVIKRQLCNNRMKNKKGKKSSDKGEENKSSSNTNQFYHSNTARIQDTDTYSIGENDKRYRPLLIENLKQKIESGDFKVSRDEVLKIIRQAADDVDEKPDSDTNSGEESD